MATGDHVADEAFGGSARQDQLEQSGAVEEEEGDKVQRREDDVVVFRRHGAVR